MDPRTPPPVAPSPSAASPPPPRRLKAPTPRARPHESNRPQSSSLQPQQLVSQVGYEPPHACEDSGGEGLSRNWAVLRATGGSHRAWYTEVRPSGARCRPPGQTAAGTSVASARDAREEDLRAGRRQRPHDSTSAQALALLRELRRVEPSVLASCRLQSGVPPNHTIALFASNFSHPEQPAGVSGGEARVETGTVPSFSPFSRARSARHLLPALNTLYTASAQLSPTGDRLAVLPRELTTATVRESAPHTVVAAGLHARQLESPGTGRQVGRPSVTDRPVVPSPWSRLDSPAVAQVLNRPLAWSGFSTRNSAASGGVSTDRLTGPRQLTELSLGAQRALLELATVLSRRQAVGSSRRLSPPPLPAVTAAALPQSQIDGTSRGLLHAQALEGLKRVWSVHLTRLEKVPLRNGFTVTGFKPDPPKPSPFREPAASAPLSNPVDRTTAVQSSGQGLVSPSYSRAIVPYQGLPSNAPPLLHTPPYGHGYRTDQPSATGLPDLNIPLSFPDEEIARGLRETVKGAALDARKRGIGRKLRVPTMFWTLPLKRPEKLRTLRHAVRLPEDHPLLRQVSGVEIPLNQVRLRPHIMLRNGYRAERDLSYWVFI